MKRFYDMDKISAVFYNGVAAKKLMSNGVQVWIGGGITYTWSTARVNKSYGQGGSYTTQTTFATPQKPDSNNQYVITMWWQAHVSDASQVGTSHSWIVSGHYYAGGRHIGSHWGSQVSADGNNTAAKTQSGNVTNTWDGFGVSLTHAITTNTYSESHSNGAGSCSGWGEANHTLFPA
jgi:hypothetical protein